MVTKSTLILAPHQDDEVLQCAGLIYNEIQVNHPVYVCFATNGDYEGESMVRIRKNESLEVLKHLGVDDDHVVFLGYPDTGMSAAESFLTRLLMEKHPNQIISSRYGRTQTWLADSELEWHKKRNGVSADFTRSNFINDLKDLLNKIRPTQVFLPAQYDLHGDHSGLYFLFKIANQENFNNVFDGDDSSEEDISPYYVQGSQIFQYLVHAGDDLPWPTREDFQSFSKPQMDVNIDADWEKRIRVSLSPGFSRENKLELINKYKSQKPEAYNGYLQSFAKEEEFYFIEQGDIL